MGLIGVGKGMDRGNDGGVTTTTMSITITTITHIPTQSHLLILWARMVLVWVMGMGVVGGDLGVVLAHYWVILAHPRMSLAQNDTPRWDIFTSDPSHDTVTLVAEL